ncbi:hypothetical protein X772_33725 [Mesorhizobium sp. LSJC280B00]|nr:hypothetical protein X772_33725 [Mesorhizobium sp. LSJC280B00]
MHAFGIERDQHLAGAADLAEPRQYKPDGFLDPNIRVETQAAIAVSDVADAYPQFAPLGLLPRGLVHPRPNDRKLELADVALHAEQQPVVRLGGIINAIDVDHARIDLTAKLKQ